MSSKNGNGYTTFGGGAKGGGDADKTTVDIVVEAEKGNGENTTIHPNYLNDGEKGSPECGLTAKDPFKAVTDVGPTYNYAEDSMTGNFMERPNPYDQDKTVQGKGKSFMIDR